MNDKTLKPPLLNLRRTRAVAMAVEITKELEPFVAAADRVEVLDSLIELFEKNGACWTTDKERAALGFEPRDAKGWTPSERVNANEKYLEAMIALSAVRPLPPRPNQDSTTTG